MDERRHREPHLLVITAISARAPLLSSTSRLSDDVQSAGPLSTRPAGPLLSCELPD